MSRIKSVSGASDEKLIKAHKDFIEWKNTNNKTKFGKQETNFGLATRHYKSCHRAITRNCETFINHRSYARAMVTTFVDNKKVYWKSNGDVGWTQSDRQPPPVPRNKAPVRVVYDHNKEKIYRFIYACVFHRKL